MPKTPKSSSSKLSSHINSSKTKKASKGGSAQAFAQDCVVLFMEMLMMVKLYHWKTYGYAQHKATDEFYGSLNGHVDEFIEVLMGKAVMRIDLMKHKKVQLLDLPSSSVKDLTKHLEHFKAALIKMENHPFIKSNHSTDLLNIRDEILGDLNQLSYLLTLE